MSKTVKYRTRHKTDTRMQKVEKEQQLQKVTIMNYNVQMMPNALTLTLNTWIRRKAVVEYIIFLDNMYDIDILVLNEAFTNTILKLLTSSAVAKKFPYFTNVVGNKPKSKRKKKNIRRLRNLKIFHAKDFDTESGQRADRKTEAKDAAAVNNGTRVNKKKKRCIHANSETTALISQGEKKLIKSIISETVPFGDVWMNVDALPTEGDDEASIGKEGPHFSEFLTVTGKRKFYQVLNGGVLVLSKHKILTTHALLYSNKNCPDSLSAKGAIYAKILVHNKSVNVIATHLQAEEGPQYKITRMKQIKELSKWVYSGVPSIYIEKKEPLFFVGDFNIPYHNEKQYLDWAFSKNNLNCELTRDDLETTYDSSLNDYCKYILNDFSLKYRQTLDYICVFAGSDVKILVPQTAIQTKFKPLSFIRFLFYAIPYKTTKIHHPSDHFPIYASFLI